MEVKCLAAGQWTGQCLLGSMISPVFVTIKSLKFHNLSASLCRREKLASIHTSVEKTVFCPTREGEKKTKTQRTQGLALIPTNPSVTARDEGWWEECLYFGSGKRWWWIVTNCSIWHPVKGGQKHCLASLQPAAGRNGRIDWGSKKFLSTLF